MKYKRILSISLIACITTILYGFSFSKKAVSVDTEKNRVYQYITVDSILDAFSRDTKTAREEYEGNYYLMSGKIKEISKKGDSVSIYSSSSDNTMKCNCTDKNVRNDILKFEVGDSVAVYGKLTVDVFDKEQHIQIEKIIKNPSSIKSDETFFLLNGDKFDAADTLERTLGNGRVKYLIPTNWSEIEVNIAENDLGSIEGYQYVLNKMPGNTNAVPEYVFITYFDKKLLKEASDIKKVDGVEKIIVENIEGNVDKFSSKKVHTYYDAEYQYYLGKYTDQLDAGKGYRTEYIFQEDEDKGIVLIVYVYRDNNYLSDVIFVSRFLKLINK